MFAYPRSTLGHQSLRIRLASGDVVLALMPAISAGSAQLSSQQQRMKDCNSQASGMSGDARKQFMSSCLSEVAAETKKPNCVKGKLCGNSCIAKDKVCHKP
jgi:psiF repeat-containing protein